MEIGIAVLLIPVIWIISEAVSRHAPRLFTKPEPPYQPPAIEPVKIETPQERYEKGLAKLKDLPIADEERQFYEDELRQRFIEESVR